MRSPQAHVSKDSINLQNLINRKFIDRIVFNAKNASEDPQSAERTEQQICIACFYLRSGGLVLNAFHTTKCGLCDAEMVSPNSDIHSLCINCARKSSLCRKCTGDISMNDRDKWPA